eukprot:GILK01004636.1.p1 GENE.GILK01004636.1~~GILK01004636.1.p1  ORF type:complete len:235 (-),score=39.67 GILK01004636.1:456-1160(-)
MAASAENEAVPCNFMEATADFAFWTRLPLCLGLRCQEYLRKVEQTRVAILSLRSLFDSARQSIRTLVNEAGDSATCMPEFSNLNIHIRCLYNELKKRQGALLVEAVDELPALFGTLVGDVLELPVTEMRRIDAVIQLADNIHTKAAAEAEKLAGCELYIDEDGESLFSSVMEITRDVSKRVRRYKKSLLLLHATSTLGSPLVSVRVGTKRAASPSVCYELSLSQEKRRRLLSVR